MKAFLDDLSSCVELDLSTAPSGPYSDFACRSLKRNLTKKLVTARSRGAQDLAVEKFIHFNKKCENFVLDINSSWDEELVGTVKMVLYNFFYPCGDPLIHGYLLKDAIRTGPGVAVDAEGESLYAKLFSSKVSYTSSWVKADFVRFTRSTPSLRAAFGGSRIKGYERLDTSRLTSVPKENDIDRIICIEPSLNMMYQQGLRSILERRLSSFFGISLATQPAINAELARQGSLFGSFGTIDLRSASDCVSIKLLEHLLPKQVLGWFKLLRTPRVDIRGQKHDLHMISTMGNAFTFPLQTILFAAIVRACYLQRDLQIRNPRKGITDPGSRLGNWGVFGDDIVVETSVYSRVCDCLKLFGFEPNPDKSFYQGPFRESCGSDWYDGMPIRSIYWKDLTTIQGRFAAINQCNVWTARTGISLRNTVLRLMESVPLNLVPLHEPDDSGIRVPSSFLGGVSRRYYALTIEPYKIQMTKQGIEARGWVYNSFGCYVSFLYGEVRDGTLSPRGEYRVRFRHKSTHNWDQLAVCSGEKWLAAPLERAHAVSSARDELLAATAAVGANVF